jgi:hypothetical protein
VTVTAFDLVPFATAARSALVAATPWPIVIGAISELAGDSVTALTPYLVLEDDDTGTVLAGLKVHMRGGSGAGAQAVFNEARRVHDVLTPLRMTTLGGVPVASMWRDREVPLSTDDRGRPQIISTYYAWSDRVGLT